MPNFAANITLLFTEYSFLDRFQAAAEAGFHGVEVLFPYDTPVREIATQLDRHNLSLALINCPPQNGASVAPGYAAQPASQASFRRDFDRVCEYAAALASDRIHIMSGEAEGPAAQQCFINNLIWACDLAPTQQLTIEPINQTDKPGYFLSDYVQALDILATVTAPNLGLQFDTYHAQMITGDMRRTWEKVRQHVTHIQVGGYPGRQEPIGGDIDYPAFFAHLDASGYDGWVSGEYFPAGRTKDGLSWIT